MIDDIIEFLYELWYICAELFVFTTWFWMITDGIITLQQIIYS